MNITLTPQVRPDSLALSKSGDILTINGDAFDFSFIEEGDVLPQDAVECPLLASDVTRTDGAITLKLVLPIRHTASDAAKFPASILNAPDGDIEVPA
jgi:hypothetical protein|tara:strand:+ start:188 stop:478 length:291 start_codon:yes stop_codon:yes gene_type:complete